MKKRRMNLNERIIAEGNSVLFTFKERTVLIVSL